MNDTILRNIIEYARGYWRDDGASGETVHRLADAAERGIAARALLARVAATIREPLPCAP